jgi:nitrate reductase NapE component
MTAGPVGLVVGTVFGIVAYRALQALKARVEMPETKKALQIMAVIDLVSFPVLGYLAGAYGFA